MKPVLFNMEFVLIGKFTKSHGEIERIIRKLGGKCATDVYDRVAAVISTSNEVQKMTHQMKDAQKHKIQVVTEEFLTEIQKPGVDPILYIISESICKWGGDVSVLSIEIIVYDNVFMDFSFQPYARIEEDEVITRRETVFYTKSMPEKITLKWKGE